MGSNPVVFLTPTHIVQPSSVSFPIKHASEETETAEKNGRNRSVFTTPHLVENSGP